MFDIDRVRQSWAQETAAIDAIITTINEHTAAEPIRGDGWTAQDLLGHIATAARAFPMYIRGEISGSTDIDSVNEQQRQRGRQRAWSDVQGYWTRVRDDVSNYLQTFDPATAEQPVTMPHLPQIKTAGDVLRVLILHTRSHRVELEQGFSPAQA